MKVAISSSSARLVRVTYTGSLQPCQGYSRAKGYELQLVKGCCLQLLQRLFKITFPSSYKVKLMCGVAPQWRSYLHVQLHLTVFTHGAVHPPMHPSFYVSLSLSLSLTPSRSPLHSGRRNWSPATHCAGTALYSSMMTRSQSFTADLPVDLSIHPSIYLSIHLCIYLGIYRRLYLSIHLSIYLSIYAKNVDTYMCIYIYVCIIHIRYMYI